MTIRRGASWGTVGPRDPESMVAATDRDVHRLFAGGASIVHIEGGDLAIALGAGSQGESRSGDVTSFVVDAYELTWLSPDGVVNRMRCHSHCVHGSWWRGCSWWFSAGGFVDGRELLPRSHPNDAIAEVLHVDPAMSLRQRYAARRRLRLGNHLPHPELHVQRGSSLSWESRRALPLVVDGTRVGRATAVTITVVPDACRVSIPTGVR